MVNINEARAKKGAASLLYALSEHGFTVPVNALCYYVGEAGPGAQLYRSRRRQA